MLMGMPGSGFKLTIGARIGGAIPRVCTRGLLAMAGLGLATAVGCGEGAAPGGLVRVESSIGEIGSGPGQFQYPRAMAIVPAGATGHANASLVVIDKTARVQRMDAVTGEYLGGFRMPAWGQGKPTGVDVGPHPSDPGRALVWVADTHYHRILAYDIPPADGTEVDVQPLFAFGTYGSEPGAFTYPTDIELLTDASGRLQRVLVSEYGGNDRVTVFSVRVDDDPEAPIFEPIGVIGEFGNTGEDDGDGRLVLHRPQDLWWDGERLLIVDSLNHRLVWGRLLEDATFVVETIYGGPELVGRGVGQLDHPYSAHALVDGSVLISEYGASRVQRIDPASGASLGTFGVPGRRTGELLNPWEVVVIGERAWVLDSGNNRVVGFASPARGAL